MVTACWWAAPIRSTSRRVRHDCIVPLRSLSTTTGSASTTPLVRPLDLTCLPSILLTYLLLLQAYISQSSHPHFNLSLEHYLLRSTSAQTPLCLLYRNEPCIVIGRNQNPWMELDVRRMRELGIRLVRRRSGGGAVYHVRSKLAYGDFASSHV